MPLINVQPRDMQDGTRITYFTDSVGTNSTTYTFNASQEMVMLRNKGSRDINYTIGATSGTLGRGELIKVNGTFSSVVLSSSQGTQAFEIISDEIGTISGSSDYTNLASQVAERVKTVNGIAPDGSGNVVIQTGSGGGGGTLVYSTLAALQAAYPNGSTQPAWVNEDNAWYYWSGTVTEPPTGGTDTTAPVLTITPGGNFTTSQTVTMSTNETATIFYTLDDTDPKSSGTKLTYSSPLTLTETDTVKAYAVDSANNESAVQTVTYTKQAGQSYTVSDAFTRADSTTSLGTADTGQGWTALSGTWGISNNTAYLAAGTGGIAVIDSGKADTTVQVKNATISATNMRFVFRLTDSNNYYIVQTDTGNVYKLYKNVAGTFTSLGTSTGVTPANGDVLKVVLSGSSITVYVNDVQRITATDTFNQTATKHGFAHNAANPASRWDDFSVL